MGKLFTRRARFKETVDAAGRTLIRKQGEDFFSFFGDHGPRSNVISKVKGFRLVFLVFYSNFAPLRLIFFWKSLLSMIFKGKIRSSSQFTLEV